MNTLIVYYSFTKNNETLAKGLQRELSCDIYPIREVKKRTALTILLDIAFRRLPRVMKATADLASYDHIIFIAPVWNGKIASPLRSFLTDERARINAYSFITLCGGRAGQENWLREELKKVTGKEAQAVAELTVLELLPVGQHKNASMYRVSEKDMEVFRPKIKEYIKTIQQVKDQYAVGTH